MITRLGFSIAMFDSRRVTLASWEETSSTHGFHLTMYKATDGAMELEISYLCGTDCVIRLGLVDQNPSFGVAHAEETEGFLHRFSDTILGLNVFHTQQHFYIYN